MACRRQWTGTEGVNNDAVSNASVTLGHDHPMTPEPVSTRPLLLTTEDQTPLQAVLYTAAASVHPPVLLAAALGVSQRFYARFASWLASRGHTVMTFDLRGIGASRQPQHKRSLKGLNADMLTWAGQDFAAAVAALVNAVDGEPTVRVLGHSLGAHHPIMTNARTQARIERLVSVAAGSGHWRDWARPSRRLAPLMLHLAIPLLTPVLGYFPGRALRMVGDLPGPAALQWARWCRHPDFAWGAEPEHVRPSLQAAAFDIHAFSFTDDDAMTETCTRQLLAATPACRTRLQVVAPGDVGLPVIGHMGAFRLDAAERLWPLLERALVSDRAELPT
jgi:predicted alpha/beta hydrolase